MVEVWAMNPTPNSMYMAHQYRLLDCKRGFSANKSRKMVMQTFTISVVFFIFCCKFYTFFFMFVCWGIVVRSANDAACFAAFWQTVSNVWQSVLSASAIGSQPISWVYVGILRSVLQSISGCTPRICGMFATC